MDVLGAASARGEGVTTMTVSSSPAPIRCPRCKNSVLQKAQDGMLTLRPKGPVRFANGACQLDCYFCGESLELGLDLGVTSKERLVVRR